MSGLMLAAACGGKSQTEGSRAAAGGAENAAGGAAAGGAAAGAAQCAQFNEEKPRSVSVLIRNDTASTINVGQVMQSCSDAPLFELRDGSGQRLDAPGFCRVPCESQMSDNPSAGCPAICIGPTALTLQPGESHTVMWESLFQVQTQLPKGCYPNHPDRDQPSLACDRAQRVPPGSYVFTASAGTALECSSGDPACSPCTPSAQGGCTTRQAWAGGNITVAETSVDLDASYGLSDADDPGADGALNVVEIVFKD